MANENKLPAIKDLVNDVVAYQKADEFNYLMSQQPPKAWIKKHPIIKKEVRNDQGQLVKVPYEYLPIDKIEYLLRRIFKKYKIEVLSTMQMFNAVSVTVRIHYKDVTSGEWMYHDGVGAWALQLDKGASASDLSAIKQSAVTMALPLAKTLAIKDACDMFGDLFGANLNRQDVVSATMDADIIQEKDKPAIILDLYDELEEHLTEEDKINIKRIIDTKEVFSYSKVIKNLTKLKTTINAKN